jgi:hypothetical protein
MERGLPDEQGGKHLERTQRGLPAHDRQKHRGREHRQTRYLAGNDGREHGWPGGDPHGSSKISSQAGAAFVAGGLGAVSSRKVALLTERPATTSLRGDSPRVSAGAGRLPRHATVPCQRHELPVEDGPAERLRRVDQVAGRLLSHGAPVGLQIRILLSTVEAFLAAS